MHKLIVYNRQVLFWVTRGETLGIGGEASDYIPAMALLHNYGGSNGNTPEAKQARRRNGEYVAVVVGCFCVQFGQGVISSLLYVGHFLRQKQ